MTAKGINPSITQELVKFAVYADDPAEKAVWNEVAKQYVMNGEAAALGWINGWWYCTGNRHSWSNITWKKARILLGEAEVI